MITKTYSSAVDGIGAATVQIEAISLNSLPQIHLTGLPGEVVKESRERVRACLVNLGYDVPTAKVLVHLSPANIKKTGSHYDLAIAVAVLASESKLLNVQLQRYAFLGEVSLDGSIRTIKCALPLVEALVENPDIKNVIIPKGNETEGTLINNKKILLANSLQQVIDFLKDKVVLPECQKAPHQARNFEFNLLDQIIGQEHAKRALQISLAGRHHLLLVGKPGVGKSMLSNASRGLLPELTSSELIDVLKIYGISSSDGKDILESKQPPFRTPHHSISANALLGGGGGTVWPGEVSLAHQGVLFMDEFPEFRRDAIEGLREPMQNGILNLNRIGKSLTLPARFTLIAAMNPCPCGMYSSLQNRCRCSPEKLSQYKRKLSRPIMDRMSLMANLSDPKESHSAVNPLGYLEVKSSIRSAIEIQRSRFSENKNVSANGEVECLQGFSDFTISSESETWIKAKQQSEFMSFRSKDHLIKVARTIADLEKKKNIEQNHIVEAWGLRCIDIYHAN